MNSRYRRWLSRSSRRRRRGRGARSWRLPRPGRGERADRKHPSGYVTVCSVVQRPAGSSQRQNVWRIAAKHLGVHRQLVAHPAAEPIDRHRDTARVSIRTDTHRRRVVGAKRRGANSEFAKRPVAVAIAVSCVSTRRDKRLRCVEGRLDPDRACRKAKRATWERVACMVVAEPGTNDATLKLRYQFSDIGAEPLAGSSAYRNIRSAPRCVATR